MTSTRILVVDDERHMRDILQRLLGEEGYDVRTAESVGQALDLAAALPPDLVIADVHMPGATGLDLVERLPAACGLRIPVLLLSGLDDEADILAGFDSGACDYLCKPWRNEELLAKVRLHSSRRAPAVSVNPNQAVRTLGNGRVQLGRQIGVGGMGSVFVGEDTRLGREVAVKILRPDLASDQSYVVRFLQEARVLSRLDLPGVPKVYDVGREDDLYYYVMDLLQGQTLRERVREGGPLSPAEIVDLGAGVAEILEALEREQVLHRDIKPDNLLLLAGGTVGLVDFGLARGLHDARLTDPSQVVGTAGYLAPEQLVSDEPPDMRGDLYSLGMALYFAATGRDPGSKDTDATLMLTMSAKPVRLDRYLLDAPPELVELVGLLTAPVPSDRPKSARRTRILFDRVKKALRVGPVDVLARAG